LRFAGGAGLCGRDGRGPGKPTGNQTVFPRPSLLHFAALPG
jgi:hypothetical protein